MMARLDPTNGASARPAPPPMNIIDAVADRVKPSRATIGSSSGAAMASAPARVPRLATRMRHETITPSVAAPRPRFRTTRITPCTMVAAIPVVRKTSPTPAPSMITKPITVMSSPSESPSSEPASAGLGSMSSSAEITATTVATTMSMPSSASAQKRTIGTSPHSVGACANGAATADRSKPAMATTVMTVRSPGRPLGASLTDGLLPLVVFTSLMMMSSCSDCWAGKRRLSEGGTRGCAE